LEIVPDPNQPIPQTARLVFARLSDADAPDLASVLSDPEVTRSIMAKATTPKQCLECAHQRIAWHNSSWDSLGYGVWALREETERTVSDGPIIGWCGLTATSHGPTPELLYGFAQSHWGQGLATEAARSTIDWAFTNDICRGIDAVIFGSLNPGSGAVAKKLGMVLTHNAPFSEFLPDQKLGKDVLDYEIWRLREGSCLDVQSLLFQAPFKAGLLVSAEVADEEETLLKLVSAATNRADRNGLDDAAIAFRVTESFGLGLEDCQVDVYHLSKSDWTKNRAFN
jgi:RimJ/RimL family protein N-acetyltransferase